MPSKKDDSRQRVRDMLARRRRGTVEEGDMPLVEKLLKKRRVGKSPTQEQSFILPRRKGLAGRDGGSEK